MRDEVRSGVLAITLGLSLAAHIVTYLLVPAHAIDLLTINVVDVGLVETPDEELPPEPPPPPDEPPIPEETPAPAPPPPRTREPTPPPPPPDQPPPTPPPAQQAPYRFEEILTGAPGSGSGFSVPEGGVAANRPVAPGRSGGTAPRGAREGQPEGTAEREGPREVPLADLSSRPSAPNLNSQLLSNYPRRARQQGIEGDATLRMRINPDGSVSAIRVVSESVPGEGFGAACVRTVDGSRWSPPRDRSGRPVSTQITYRCQFRVRY